GGLVEIHGQHASAHLLRAASHMEIVDQFAGNGSLLQACGSAWQRLKDTRAARCQIEADLRSALEQRDELLRDIEDLRRLAPVAGEARTLARQRQQLSQVSKLRDTLKEVKDALFANETVERAGWAAGSLQRLTKLPGFDAPSASNGLEQLLTATADAFERAAIELNEAVESLSRLADVANGDDLELEHIEGRLFALRAAARKHRVDVDSLSDCLERLECSLQLTDRGDQQLAAARKEEADAAAQWRAAAESLSQARRVAAQRLEKVVKRQLVPLKLEKVRLRFRIDPLTEEEAGHRGMDKIAIEVETNPGSGFGPLHKIASGGELARISLALKCAAAESSETPVTMIFDEADQGVGGAVAAAIGERLQELATRHQVFAVTHSPQVAASAEAHWRIEKSGRGKSLGQMRASVLDAQERTEEIARMLSGLKITREARAAAHRLLEG
ncbi:MAG: DNA repair protein RecN, partial [Pseudomonadota bacterium]